MWNYRPAAWILPGIIIVGLLTFVSMLLKSEIIENDLTQRAVTNLSAKHSWAQVEADGRDLKICGTARTQAGKEEALVVSDGVFLNRESGTWGVRVVDGRCIETLPLQAPYAFGAERHDGIVHLTGSVPSDEVRADLVAKAKSIAGGDSVRDDMTLAAGEPSGFSDKASYAIGLLGEVDAGKATISDANLDFSGSVDSAVRGDLLKGKLTPPLPHGLVLGNANVVAPAPPVVEAPEPAPAPEPEPEPVVSPYKWSAVLKDNSVTASGYMPDEESQAGVKSTLEAFVSGGSVIDNTEIGNGSPDGLVDVAKFGAGFLTELEKGTIEITDTHATLSGVVPHNASLPGIESRFENSIPNGFTGNAVLSQSPPPAPPVVEAPEPAPAPEPEPEPVVSPYKWSAVLKDNSVTASGYMPDEESQAGVKSTLEAFVSGGSVIDNTEIGNGSPDGLVDVAKFGAGFLTELEKGTIEITDTHATLSGVVPHNASLPGIESRFENSIPNGFTGNAVLSQSPPPAPPVVDNCTAQIINAATNITINFETARATILSDSFGVLDGVAEVALNCPDAKFEISGHTDSDGSKAFNQRLSLARAGSVSDYLQRAGVSADRLQAVGFGEEQPIAANNTPENKALNRRIEFKLIVE